MMLLDGEESAATRTATFKTRGRKRKIKVSKVQQILNNLPDGVKYIGPEGGMTEENVLAYAKDPNSFNDRINNIPEDEIIFGERTPPQLNLSDNISRR